MLDKFWRYYTTESVSTQTEEKVIDSLKFTIGQQKDIIKDLRRKLADLENQKIDLETECDRYKAISDLARKTAKEKEDALNDMEDAKESMMQQIGEAKEKEKNLVERFRQFAEDISNLKV